MTQPDDMTGAAGLNILLVEDDHASARLVMAHLANGHLNCYRVTHRPTLREGLQALAAETFDCILLDLGLPDSQGIGTLRAMLAAHDRTPIVVLTGQSDDELGLHLVEAGAQDYLSKDDAFSTRLLERSLLHAIGRQKLLERERASESRFDRLLHAATDAILAVDRQGTVLYANPMAQRIFAGGEELTGAAFGVPLTGGESAEIEIAGKGLTCELRSADIEWQGAPAHLVTVHDITDRKRVEQMLRASEKELEARVAERTAELYKLSSAIEQTADTVLITDPKGVIEYVNPSFERIAGYSRAEALGQTPRLLKSGLQNEDFYRRLWDTIKRGEVFRETFVNRHKNGMLYYEEKTITPLKDDRGKVIHYLATGKDITEQMQAQQRLQRLFSYDALTDLPNRTLLTERLSQSLERAARHGLRIGVLCVGLDRFKVINDTLGRDAGDRLLQQIAKRLTCDAPQGSTVARLGGDEFAILPEEGDADGLSALAAALMQTMTQPFENEGVELFLNSSIGIGCHPNDGEDAATLLKNAETAMHRARELGAAYQFYTADMNARAVERLSLESQLRHALERGEFVLHYQPQVETGSGRVQGVEALLRWQHPERGLVPPDMFVPLLEDGLIVAVGEWVLRTACAQQLAWQAAGLAPLRMSVNLSPRQFQGGRLPETIESALGETGMDPRHLKLEITETVMMQRHEETAEMLQQFRNRGIMVSIDDFGTGYSSLAYLTRFPVDELKIDRAFVTHLPDNEGDAQITRAVIALAHSLGLNVIAEGVENEAQLAFLRQHDCDCIQGYLYSRPLPAAELEEFLAGNRASGGRDGQQDE